MPDYGHPLRFATFISPTNSPAHRPVELAQLSERLGFDFVTFQDHPYQSSFLDTWTLLSWVAARTERIGVSGNVLNLPLRQPPAVLARAAASLDLLSGGRTSLGLGAGFFWDAVQAIGGRRLTPLQGVAALGEAIDVIRGVWDADGPGTLNVDGEFYSGPRRRARTRARTRDPDLARRPQAEDAGPGGTQGRRLAAVAAGHGARRPAEGKRDHRRRRTGRRPRPPRHHPSAQHLPGPADSRKHWPRWPSRTASASSSWPATTRTYSNASPPKRSPPYANTSPADAHTAAARP